MVQMAAGLAAFNTSSPIGNQASGYTGRSRLMSGLTMRFRKVKRPIMKPIGMPTAAAMPEVSADFTTFTFSIRPGIHFADDPAFKGRPRELTAEDYVYSLKRHYDPRWKSCNLYILESAKILGLS